GLTRRRAPVIMSDMSEKRKGGAVHEESFAERGLGGTGAPSFWIPFRLNPKQVCFKPLAQRRLRRRFFAHAGHANGGRGAERKGNRMQTRRAKLMAALILDNGKCYVRAFFSVMVALSIALLTPLVMAETIDAIIGTRPLNAPDFVVRAFEAIGGRDYVANNLWIVALLLLVLSVIRSTF